MLRRLSLGASILACLALAGHAFAQAGPSPSPAPAPAPAPAANPGEGGGATPGQGSVVSNSGGAIIVQPAPMGGTTYAPGPNPNAGLPSSSQPRVGNDRDGF